MTDPTKALCWDKSWKYVPKESTDITKTWAKAIRQQKQAAQELAANNVCPLKKARKA